jgi:hypothetical protein
LRQRLQPTESFDHAEPPTIRPVIDILAAGGNMLLLLRRERRIHGSVRDVSSPPSGTFRRFRRSINDGSNRRKQGRNDDRRHYRAVVYIILFVIFTQTQG